jgi:hypothetical protein
MIRKGYPPNKCRLCGINKSQGQNVYSASAKREGLLSKISKHLSKEVNAIRYLFLCLKLSVIAADFTKVDVCLRILLIQCCAAEIMLDV